MANRFEGFNIFGWAIDDWEQFYQAIEQEMGRERFERVLNDYKSDSFSEIEKLFESAPLPLNLGGQTEKSRLVATDKPMGIFDFGLATRGMYKVPEYFSQKLADEFPNKFDDFELPSGIVPPNLVKGTNGNFYYEDIDGTFDCIIQQKGTRAIDLHIKGAKKKFATQNKKVYLTFRKNRGKVKYVEIYSLFYYTSLSGDIEFAVRHIPAIMVAEYLESIGVKTRFYMTRFVSLDKKRLSLRKATDGGARLPMYDRSIDRSSKDNLFIQPIIAKDFGQDFDKALAFLISSNSQEGVYKAIANYALKKEITNNDFSVYGTPDWSQDDYFEGIERYRNKYQEYNKTGLFKSKELLPEAMLFFHDMVIKWRFSTFMSNIREYFINYMDKDEVLINSYVNSFFNWWMRLSANNLKNKIELINSVELRKDLTKIEKEIQKMVDELELIIKNTPDDYPNAKNYDNKTLAQYYREIGYGILGKTNENSGEYGYTIVDDNKQLTFKNYILTITSEISTYADGVIYETEKERKEYKDNLVESILQELQNF